MIIDFSNIGGGGGYVLPVASTEVLGGVMIGEGINIDSAGTISVTGGTGGDIEVVTELPASGTDGQMVLLETSIPEKIIQMTGTGNNDKTTSITAVGITSRTLLLEYNNYNVMYPLYAEPNGTFTLYDVTAETDINCPNGETTVFTITNSGGSRPLTFTATVESNTCVVKISATAHKANVTPNIEQHSGHTQILYTWSDSAELMSDIIYTTSTGNTYCVEYKYSELPNNKTLLVTKYDNSEFYHFVYNNGQLTSYRSDNADTYTTASATTVAQYGMSVNGIYAYWTDDEIIFASLGMRYRVSFNIDDFFKTGWHKNIEHKIDSKAFYEDYKWYDGDYQIIIKNPHYPMYDKGIKINPNSNYDMGYSIYSKSNNNFPTIFAPTTTGSTGYVCVAGSGWTAPTWAAPESLTNGVKFWKGTQDEYDVLSTYDSSTLYIIVEE